MWPESSSVKLANLVKKSLKILSKGLFIIGAPCRSHRFKPLLFMTLHNDPVQIICTHVPLLL